MADQFDPSAQNFNTDPASQMMNYQYMQNQQLMQMQQTNLQAAINTATNNAQMQMQTVLAGTMAASMALYNTGKSATDKAQERVYQDILMNGGNYVMERSAWRDFTYASGISSSDLGRGLRIGGRRPEFLSGSEYEYQKQRSWGYRKEETMDMLIGGGATMAGSAIGTAIMPGPGTAWGMAAGFIIDETVGKALAPYMQYRRAGREMRQYAESTDMNWGGQRRMSDSTAQTLGEYGWMKEKNAFDFVPFGGAIADRIRPDQTFTKALKNMGQLGLLKDTDLSNVDELKKMVNKTIEFTDKMAGVLHASREGVMQLKATFQKMGLNDLQQNAAIGSVARTSLSTGLNTETVLQAYGSFQQLGAQAGFFLQGNAGLQAESGLRELERIRAGQAAGNISLKHDAGTLAQQRFVNAAQMAASPYGTVTQFGNGSTGMAMQGLAALGGGDAQLGYLLRNTEVYGSQKGVLETQREMFRNVQKQLGFRGALGYAEQMGGTPLVNQALAELTGVNSENTFRAAYNKSESERIRIGMGHDKGYYNQFSLNDLTFKGTSTILKNDRSAYAGTLTSLIEKTRGQRIDIDSGPELHGTYKTLKNNGEFVKDIGLYLHNVERGEDPSVSSTKKAKIIASIKSQHDVTDAQADKIFYTAVNETDQWNSQSFGSQMIDLKIYPSMLHRSKGDSLDHLRDLAAGSSIAALLSKKWDRLDDSQYSKKDYDALVTELRKDPARVDAILEEIAKAGDDRGKKAEIYKKHGMMGMKVGSYAHGMMGMKFGDLGIMGSDTLAGMALYDEGKNLHGNSKAMQSAAALQNIYGSMTPEERARVAKLGVNDAVGYVTANQKWAGALGVLGDQALADIAAKKKKIDVTDEQIYDMAKAASINGAYEDVNAIAQRFRLARNTPSVFLDEAGRMAKVIQTGGAPEDRSKEEANLEAIKSFTEVCKILTLAIGNNQ